jgi:hypothetical protein
MPAAEDLLARTPGWDAIAGGRDGDGWVSWRVWQVKGWRLGRKATRFAPARCLRAAARPGVGRSDADRQVSQVETGAAGERCTAGGWDSSTLVGLLAAREQQQHGMH